MIHSNKKLILALAYPIVALILLAGYKSYLLNTGREVTLPITGYDPRDLLSGHYLTYRVDYGIENICPGMDKIVREAYICLDPKQFSFQSPSGCQLKIVGTCKRYNRFEAGIERFYIPEEKARELDKKVRGGQASIVVSLSPSGTAQIKDLLIDGQPWQSQSKVE